jgi:hypothetical protein
MQVRARPWRWFDLSIPPGSTELNSFGGIFSGIVITEKCLVMAKFLRGSWWLPYGHIDRVRGGWFADKPDDADEIRLWGLEIQSGREHYTVGVWNWGPACEIIERAIANAKTADTSRRSKDVSSPAV